MSRFFQTNSQRTRHLAQTVPVTSPALTTTVANVPAAQPSSTELAVDRTSIIDDVGVIALALYTIAGLATDLTLRLLDTKSYASLVAGLLVLVTFLLSGKALRGLKFRVGQLWLFLMLWMLMAIPTSQWRGGSFDV